MKCWEKNLAQEDHRYTRNVALKGLIGNQGHCDHHYFSNAVNSQLYSNRWNWLTAKQSPDNLPYVPKP